MIRHVPLILLILLFIFIASSSATSPKDSQRKIDSLKTALTKTKNLHQQTSLLILISKYERERGDYKQAILYAQQALTLAKQSNDEKNWAKALLKIGVAQRELGNYDVALNSLKQSLTLAYKVNDLFTQGDVYDNMAHIYTAEMKPKKALPAHMKALALRRQSKDEYGIANSCDNIAVLYWQMDSYLEAIKYYKEALPIFKKHNDGWRIAQTSANIGTRYREIGDYTDATKYLTEAREAYKKIENQEGVAWTSAGLGMIYIEIENDKKALEYHRESLQIYEQLQNYSGIIESYNLIANVYNKRHRGDLAMQYYNKALAIAKQNDDRSLTAMTYYTIAVKVKWVEGKLDETLHYLQLAEDGASKSVEAATWSLRAQILDKQGEYVKAKAYMEKALAYHKTTAEKTHLIADYRTLSSIQEHLGHHRAALESYKQYITYQDSFKQQDLSKTVMRYEFDKRETEIKTKQQEELNKKTMVAHTTYGILGTIIVLTAMGLYTYWVRNKKLRLEKQNLELKRREAELAKDTEAFKSQFLSNISHEFRTPLTLINGHLEILKKDGDIKSMKRYKEMEYSGQRLLQLINQLLDLTKIETGKYSLHFKKGNLLNETQNFVQAFHSQAEERKIELKTTVTSAAQVKFGHRDFVYSSEALASIFNNILSNALKFTPYGGSIQVTVDYIDNKLFISIRDTGSGIPAKNLPYIFERFYQAHQNEVFEGSGIGLSIVKELSQLHGGDVTVENNVDGGCTFTIWLAEGRSTSDAEHDNASIVLSSDHIEEYRENQGTLNEDSTLILVVEDQRELRKFIIENLEPEFRFLEAENGKQGIKLAMEHVPDIIISDVMMPEMSGFQLTEVIKRNEITSHIPIMLLTAKAQQSDKILGLEHGADDYLTKPFSVAELRLRIKNRLSQQQAFRSRFADKLLIPAENETPELNLVDRIFIEKLNNIVISHMESGIDVSLLASEIGLSTSQLTRKLKVLTGVTPANFVKKVQLGYSLELLRKGHSVSEASWKSGFSEPAYFSKVFKKHFNFLPSEKEKL